MECNNKTFVLASRDLEDEENVMHLVLNTVAKLLNTLDYTIKLSTQDGMSLQEYLWLSSLSSHLKGEIEGRKEKLFAGNLTVIL